MKKPAAPMKTYVYVKPASRRLPGADEATMLKIRDPGTRRHIPAHGAKVELTTDISRMLLVPKPNRPRAPRLHRGPDLVQISKEDFDKGAEKAAKAVESAAKKIERDAAKADKKRAEEVAKAEEPAKAPESTSK